MDKEKSCSACKATSVCCFCGIGTYLILVGRTYPTKSKIFINLLGLGSFALGIRGMYDLLPLKNDTENNRQL
ncbi:unnamed protein product [Phyllotreta striolata]|uniref:Uncharacterized protein n=1 Tax=Phyllotreta striolata TaxID=444603 RepID=A0A9N9TFR2_PHYSR|nr:unnamed protein product [Phyllotreta striolata]